MKLVTRAAWGAKPSRYPLNYIAATKGVKIHYEGAPVPTSLAADHGKCPGRVRQIQASHLANPKENYSDIAYNFAVCPHGYVFEGRGLHKKTGANGTGPLNTQHYAVLALLGDEGLTQPTDAMLHGLRDAIEYLRAKGGAGKEIKGHRDGHATECPGGPLYTWVQKGAPRPGGSTGNPSAGSGGGPSAKPKPMPPFPGSSYFGPGKANAHITLLGKQLVKKGFGRHYTSGPGPKWSEADRKNVADFQRSRPELRGDADGLPGPLTWRLLFS
jgi:hypothetical protein